jgi:TonB family protein
MSTRTGFTYTLGIIRTFSNTLIGATLTIFVSLASYAQQSERKAIYQVAPHYPTVLKDRQIGGVVRISAVVSPSGLVKRTEVVGGNPALAAAAENALKDWKYEPAARETREIVTFRFDPLHRR